MKTNNEEKCFYCNMKLPSTEDKDRKIFKWHLAGHEDTSQPLPVPVKEITIKEAVDRLVKAFNADPSFEYGWQANIAVAMQDAYALAKDKKAIHAISNEGAKRFLILLKQLD